MYGPMPMQKKLKTNTAGKAHAKQMSCCCS